MQAIEMAAITDMGKLSHAQAIIAGLKTELKRWQEEEKMLLDGVLDRAVFAEDKFLVTLKKKGDSYLEGDFKLLRMRKDTRTVIPEKFLKSFPDIGAKICTIPVTKAEALIGKANMPSFCETKTSYSYEVVNMEIK